ncbi:histidine kinase [Streptomyces sp. DSM 44917]|uniref:histidine kinase n=1 Tax=Streptomyces boetiae TaxID=3075541 RepID=A0ABU2LDT5_9ACTN|nr:histidine kinase [Streptomyces sp. DSM 44917]MDT0309744.1 histidine kinase [Streptomyces sp. DSM 44917]
MPASLAGAQLAVCLAAGAGRPAVWQTLLGLLVVAAAWYPACRARPPGPAAFAATLLADGAGEALLPEPAVAPGLPLAAWVVLFRLASARAARAALLAAALATFVVTAPLAGGAPAGRVADDLAAGALLHLAIVLAGQVRRQRATFRAALAGRLAGAGRARRAAIEAERAWLTRELHDAAGHHLTAVVVQGAAALRPAGPAVPAGEALARAAESGRAALEALGRLAAGEAAGRRRSGPLHRLLRPLCAGLGPTGAPVALTVAGLPRRLAPETLAAGEAIVREALTNAMRHAAGAPVAVRVRYRAEAVEIAVVSGAARLPCLPSGGGRGLAGLRARAEPLGGRVAAGPVPGPAGGWAVRATLPRGPRLPAADAPAFVACALLPVLLGPVPPAPVPLLALAAHAVPLLWRRRAPWAALGGMLAVALACAAAGWAGLLDPRWLGALAFASGAELLGVHAVAAHGRGRLSWAAPAAVGAAAGVVCGAAASAGPGGTLLLALAGLAAAPWLLPVWALGELARSRRGEGGGRRDRRLLAAMANAARGAAETERRRVTAGLGEAVLRPTARLVRQAESTGDPATTLAEVTAEARRALAGMRELLATLDPGAAR